jgi:hypothetical protein
LPALRLLSFKHIRATSSLSRSAKIRLRGGVAEISAIPFSCVGDCHGKRGRNWNPKLHSIHLFGARSRLCPSGADSPSCPLLAPIGPPAMFALRSLSGDKRTYRGGPLLTLQRFRLRAPPQMQRLSTLMWQSLDLGRLEGAASRFTATSGSMSLLPLPGFGS